MTTEKEKSIDHGKTYYGKYTKFEKPNVYYNDVSGADLIESVKIYYKRLLFNLLKVTDVKFVIRQSKNEKYIFLYTYYIATN
jgi:hypothetical protein